MPTASSALDRGGWQLSSMSKGFVYIFNTTQEDQKVAKSLGGWSIHEKARLPDLTCFDRVVREKINCFQRQLFSTCIGLSNCSFNVNLDVVDVLTATSLFHHPEMKSLNPDCPYMQRISSIATTLGVVDVELLAWSAQVQSAFFASESAPAPSSNTTEEEDMKGMHRLLQSVHAEIKHLSARVATLEQNRAMTRQEPRVQDVPAIAAAAQGSQHQVPTKPRGRSREPVKFPHHI